MNTCINTLENCLKRTQKKECLMCAHKKYHVVECAHMKCSYNMCKRCRFLYGRAQCPACRRSDAFATVVVSQPRHCRVLNDILYILSVLFFAIAATAIIVLCMASMGVFVVAIIFPGRCCKDFLDFITQGIFAFIITAVSVCCVCCFVKGGNDDE